MSRLESFIRPFNDLIEKPEKKVVRDINAELVVKNTLPAINIGTQAKSDSAFLNVLKKRKDEALSVLKNFYKNFDKNDLKACINNIMTFIKNSELTADEKYLAANAAIRALVYEQAINDPPRYGANLPKDQMQTQALDYNKNFKQETDSICHNITTQEKVVNESSGETVDADIHFAAYRLRGLREAQADVARINKIGVNMTITSNANKKLKVKTLNGDAQDQNWLRLTANRLRSPSAKTNRVLQRKNAAEDSLDALRQEFTQKHTSASEKTSFNWHLTEISHSTYVSMLEKRIQVFQDQKLLSKKDQQKIQARINALHTRSESASDELADCKNSLNDCKDKLTNLDPTAPKLAEEKKQLEDNQKNLEDQIKNLQLEIKAIPEEIKQLKNVQIDKLNKQLNTAKQELYQHRANKPSDYDQHEANIKPFDKRLLQHAETLLQAGALLQSAEKSPNLLEKIEQDSQNNTADYNYLSDAAKQLQNPHEGHLNNIMSYEQNIKTKELTHVTTYGQDARDILDAAKGSQTGEAYLTTLTDINTSDDLGLISLQNTINNINGDLANLAKIEKEILIAPIVAADRANELAAINGRLRDNVRTLNEDLTTFGKYHPFFTENADRKETCQELMDKANNLEKELFRKLRFSSSASDKAHSMSPSRRLKQIKEVLSRAKDVIAPEIDPNILKSSFTISYFEITTDPATRRESYKNSSFDISNLNGNQILEVVAFLNKPGIYTQVFEQKIKELEKDPNKSSLVQGYRQLIDTLKKAGNKPGKFKSGTAYFSKKSFYVESPSSSARNDFHAALQQYNAIIGEERRLANANPTASVTVNNNPVTAGPTENSSVSFNNS